MPDLAELAKEYKHRDAFWALGGLKACLGQSRLSGFYAAKCGGRKLELPSTRNSTNNDSCLKLRVPGSPRSMFLLVRAG